MKPGDIVWHKGQNRRLKLIKLADGAFDWETEILDGLRAGEFYLAFTENLGPVPKHIDPAELWRAYSALCGLVQYTGPEHRAHIVPAINVILSCLRAAGETCGHDYPEP